MTDVADAEVTFRDFAGALMGGKDQDAAGVLQRLLDLGEADAQTATGFFRTGMEQGGQAFMMNAMGLRTAVTSRDGEQTRSLLRQCFDLQDDTLEAAVAALDRRYA